MKTTICAFLTLLVATAGTGHSMTSGSPGDRALDRVPSAPIGVGVIEPEDDGRWWQVNASTGWDSLYMDRGVNVLGNGNGLYWWAIDLGFDVWEGGTITPGVCYGVGSHWNRAQPGQAFKEWLVFVDFTQSFGDLSVSTGWESIYLPMDFEVQNEIYVALAYDWTIGAVTITPNTGWYYNLGPQAGTPGGAISGGASYWILGLSADVPVARDGAVSLGPWASFGINFNYNERGGDPLLDIDGEPFIGGNNVEFGLAVPLRFTRWFTLAPYVAFSHQWQNLGAGAGSPGGLTAANTGWTGVSANFNF